MPGNSNHTLNKSRASVDNDEFYTQYMNEKDKDRISVAIIVILGCALIILTVMLFSAITTPTQAHGYSDENCEPKDGWYLIGNEWMQLQIPYSDFEDEADEKAFRQSWIFEDVSCAQLVKPDDENVLRIASKIQSKYGGLDELKLAGKVSGFVWRNIEYATDMETYGAGEYWATPTETLYLGQGDCEDLSILTCSILLAIGLDGVLLHYTGHYAPGLMHEGKLYSLDGGLDPNPNTIYNGEYPTVYTIAKDSDTAGDPLCTIMYDIKDSVLGFLETIHKLP